MFRLFFGIKKTPFQLRNDVMLVINYFSVPIKREQMAAKIAPNSGAKI